MLKPLLKQLPLYLLTIVIAFFAGYQWHAYQQASTAKQNIAAAQKFFDIDEPRK